ncbi:MAG: SWIM zinc finger family protein [Myxococcota bacterium]
MATALVHAYHYPSASAFEAGPKGASLRLATSGGVAPGEPAPHFFEGELVEPATTARLLRVLSRVVGSRWHIPPAMLARILREADPVVTSGGGMLRFEGFSACASAYARVDLGPEAYAGDVVGQGTTNVDFNADMRAALALVKDGERVRLSVGADRLTLERAGAAVIERQVPLPERWLRSFLEVQAYQAHMAPRLDVSGLEALRFLRGLPRAVTKQTAWVVPAGKGLRLGVRHEKGAVGLHGLERLRVLEDVAPWARRLRVWSDDAMQASAWALDFGAQWLWLALSAEAWRGFSGEGQMLTRLAKAEAGALARVRATLRWQSAIVPADAAEADALARLGARGLVGYDLRPAAYFHRELPFDLDQVESLQPRLRDARALLATTGVRWEGDDAVVRGSDVEHRVREVDGVPRCTCPWFARHQGERGPCKHILAAELARESREAGTAGAA